MRMNSSRLLEMSPQYIWDLTKEGWFFSMQAVFAVQFQLGRILIYFAVFLQLFHKKHNLSCELKQYWCLLAIQNWNKNKNLH